MLIMRSLLASKAPEEQALGRFLLLYGGLGLVYFDIAVFGAAVDGFDRSWRLEVLPVTDKAVLTCTAFVAGEGGRLVDCDRLAPRARPLLTTELIDDLFLLRLAYAALSPSALKETIML